MHFRQVTECLWLIYSLEEKAKVAGGYVHFILGNHEIMNLNGDARYLHKKYRINTSLVKLSYQKLYNEDSELGRWLRTKNIIEKIGDLLFVHGGINRELNNLNVSIDQINRLSRPYYANDSLAVKSSDQVVLSVYGKSTSPFWDRGYYRSSGRTEESVVDSTLAKFQVSKIVTGHTIVANQISVHYNGKVINTDTKHAKGESEALLIEGNNYYSVNGEGKREKLFDKAAFSKR